MLMVYTKDFGLLSHSTLLDIEPRSIRDLARCHTKHNEIIRIIQRQYSGKIKFCNMTIVELGKTLRGKNNMNKSFTSMSKFILISCIS